MVENASNTSGSPPDSRQFPWKGALAMVAAVAAFYLLREHWNHIAGSAAYLLLLACPLMHLFGHSHRRGPGHTHHGGGAGQADSKDSREGPF
jgi:hypothetical protein